jgi:two-component system NtrC family response regulator
VPPLRERRGDIAELAAHLVRRAARAAGRAEAPVLTGEALERLVAYPWPGNVRELENCLMRAVVLAAGGVIHVEHLALDAAGPASPQPLASLDAVAAAHVAHVLRAVGGNRTRAAEVLGVSRPRLRRLIERFGLGDSDQ